MATRNELKNVIGGRLREAINLKGVSLTAFAGASGIKYRTLQDYLSGTKAPGADALAKIAAQGIDVNWLLLGPDGLIVAFPEELARPQQRPPWLSSTKLAAHVIELAVSRTEQKTAELEAAGKKITNDERVHFLAGYYAMYTGILDLLSKALSDDEIQQVMDTLHDMSLDEVEKV